MARKESEFGDIDRRDVLKGVGAGAVGIGASTGLANAHHPGDVQVGDCPETIKSGEEFTVDVTWEGGHAASAEACFRAWLSDDETNWEKVGETTKTDLGVGETETFEMTARADVTACRSGKTYTLRVNASEAYHRCPKPGECGFPILCDDCQIEIEAPSDVTWINKEMTFDDCQDAKDYLEAGNLLGNYPEESNQPMTSVGGINESGDDPVTVSTEVNFSMNRPKIEITKPKWPNMTNEETEARDEYLCELENHELGHVNLANTVAEAFSKTLSAEGSNRGQAVRKLQDLINEHKNQFASEFDRLQSRYDELTEHGATQSQGSGATYTIKDSNGDELATDTFRGGDDAVLNCP